MMKLLEKFSTSEEELKKQGIHFVKYSKRMPTEEERNAVWKKYLKEKNS